MGILMLVTALGFGVVALADFLLLVRVHKLYRGTGGSMAKAQAEFASGVMKNETVRQAAAEAATAQVRRLDKVVFFYRSSPLLSNIPIFSCYLNICYLHTILTVLSQNCVLLSQVRSAFSGGQQQQQQQGGGGRF